MTPHTDVLPVGQTATHTNINGAEPRYFSLDLQNAYVGGDRTIVHSDRSDIAREMSVSDALLLLSCREPRTLLDHARRCAAKLEPGAFTAPPSREAPAYGTTPRSDAAIKAAAIRLGEFARGGLLETESAFVASIRCEPATKHFAAEDARITSICIPTRNRPEPLRRALTSYLESDVQFGRDSSFVVFDDSDSAQLQRENHDILLDLSSRYGRRVYYASRSDRERYVRRLAQYSSVPEHLVRFALIGDARCTTSFGATRNSANADTAGELILQTDDDTICHVAKSPTVARGLQVTSEDPQAFWFWAELEEALQFSPRANIDFDA